MGKDNRDGRWSNSEFRTDSEIRPHPEDELLDSVQTPEGKRYICRRIAADISLREHNEIAFYGLAGIGKTTIMTAMINYCQKVAGYYGVELVPHIKNFGDYLAAVENLRGISRDDSDTKDKMPQIYRDSTYYFGNDILKWRREQSVKPKTENVKEVLFVTSTFVRGIKVQSHYPVEVWDYLYRTPGSKAHKVAVFGPDILERARQIRTDALNLDCPDEKLVTLLQIKHNIKFLGLDENLTPVQAGQAVRKSVKATARPDRLVQLKKYYDNAAHQWLEEDHSRSQLIREIENTKGLGTIAVNEVVILAQMAMEKERMMHWGKNTHIFINPALKGPAPFYVGT